MATAADEGRRLESLLSHLPGMAYVCEPDPRWTMRYVSEGALDLTGYTADELLGEGGVAFVDLIVEADRPLVRAAVLTALDTASTFTISYELRHRNGSIRWVWEQGGAHAGGRQVEGLILDVTDRVHGELRLQQSEHHHRRLVESSPDAIVLSSGGRIAYANPAAIELFAADRPLVGAALLDLVHRDDHAAVRRATRSTERESRDSGPTAYRVVTGRGQIVEVEVRSVAVTLSETRGTESIIRDTSERVRAERHRVAMQCVFEQVATDAPLRSTLDAIARIVDDRLPGRFCSIMLVADGHLHDGAAPSLPASYRAAIDGVAIGPAQGSCGTAAWSGEAVASDDIASDPRWAAYADVAADAGLAACWSLPIELHDGTVAATFGLYGSEPGSLSEEDMVVLTQMRDVAAVALERDASRTALERCASYDELTGLPNRRTLLASLVAALEHREPGRVAVLFIDLDDFKDVNDSFGHDAGDVVLQAAGHLLDAALDDTSTIARFSGDEFVVVCDDVEGAAQVESVVARLQASLSQPFRHEGQELLLHASIGIAVSSAGESAEELLAKSDAAMYCAKETGGGAHSWFDQQLRERAARRLELGAALSGALEADELEVHYQPSVRLTDGEILGFEALVRWTRPGHGAVSPAELIPIAESSGLIVALGAKVLRDACSEAARWALLRPALACRVAVNVSPKQLHHAGLVDTVAGALVAAGLPPRLLCLEVTEGGIMGDVEASARVLRSLKALGVSIAVDDFGTGYSSLSRLRHLPVDTIKIDRSFVAELGRSDEDGAIVAAIIAVADALGMGVVAEGVETEGQRQALLHLGCEESQGFLWSPAVAATAVTGLLASTG